jgi:glucokinase
VRAVGIDVGGTKCRCLLIEFDGDLSTVRASDVRVTVLADTKVDTPADATLVDVIARLIDDCGPVDAVGVGLPGLVTSEGVVRTSPHLAWVGDWDAAGELSRRAQRPVVVDNDATCAAVAEWMLGAGGRCDDMWLVTLGTGIGGGLISGGEVRRGAHGHAGEIGHIHLGGVAPGDRDVECPCGQRGCWEVFASGAALARRAGCASGEEVVARVRAGDAAAREALADWADAVARGLAMLVNVTDPRRIVIGGGISEAADVILDPIRRAMPRYCYGWPARELPDVVAASLGARAGALGAALLAGIV